MKKCSVEIHETKTKCGQPAPWTHPRYKGGFCEHHKKTFEQFFSKGWVKTPDKKSR